MKDIVIVLTAREAFGLGHAGIKKTARRKMFGAFGLSEKINKEVSNTLTQTEYEQLKNEWLALRVKTPDNTPQKEKLPAKKLKDIKRASKKTGEYIIKDF